MTNDSPQRSRGAAMMPQALKGGTSKRYFKSAATGRIISESARVSAARARITADKKRGVSTEQWIIDIAKAS